MMKPTHFVCLPQNSPLNIESFQRLRRFIKEKIPETNEAMFIPEQRLHDTLFVLRLDTDDRLNSAKETLRDALAGVEPFELAATELSCFPSREECDNARSLIIVPKKDSTYVENLKRLTRLLVEAFYNAGLLSDEQVARIIDKDTGEVIIKFHSTLMNGRYETREGDRVRLDLSNIFEANVYEEVEFYK